MKSYIQAPEKLPVGTQKLTKSNFSDRLKVGKKLRKVREKLKKDKKVTSPTGKKLE